jgi:nucleotide-binding universal stress UspA family protein
VTRPTLLEKSSTSKMKGYAMKIVVGIDGSEHSLRAVGWCARYAGALGAEVLAVHAIEVPVYPSVLGYYPPPLFSPADRERLAEVLVEQWCEPLRRAKVPFRSLVTEGYPSSLIREMVEKEDADLVVVGRRGLGGFAELVLGSTSRQLSHHLDRPIVIVP